MEADVRKPYCPPGAESEKARNISAEPTDTASAQGETGRPPPANPPHFEGFQRAMQLMGEYKEYASYYMATKMDGIKASLRNVGIYAGLGIAGLMAFSALISTAVALFLVGAAMGLAHIFDPPKYWLGALIVGLAVLVLIGVGAGIGLAKANAGFRKATVDKYEQRKRWQRGQFGRDVEQAASAKKKNELSEADFLADQQAKAKAAMDTAFADMKKAFVSGFSSNAQLTEWMGAYPWVSLGVGAAVGFLTGSAFTPARDETFKERFNSLLEEVKRKEVKEEKAQKGTEKAARAAVDAQKPSFMEHVSSGLFDILKTALVSTLSGAVAGKVANDDDAPKPGNGQDGGAGGAY